MLVLIYMKKYWIIFIFVFLSFSPFLVSADMGPKPTMDFDFVGIPTGQKIVKVQLYECGDPQCSTINLFEEFGPQRLECSFTKSGSTCFSMAYGYEPYQKLIVTFSDKIRESNIFSPEGMESFYKVQVGRNDLTVRSIYDPPVDPNANFFTIRGSLNQSFEQGISIQYTLSLILSLILTIILEVLVVLGYSLIKKVLPERFQTYPKGLIIWVSLVNVITLPLLWMVAYYSPLDFHLFIKIAEALIVLFEAWFIVVVTRQKAMWKEILLLSIVMNTASYFMGDYIISMITR